MSWQSRATQSQIPERIRCAIYTRKSTEEGLQQDFNSLDAQRESAEAFISSQQHEGWTCLPIRYDDGGFTGGNMDRPALRRLMADIEAGRIDCVVVYKVDRLSRSLLDFARMMEAFERHRVSFVSVTQQFNTSTSMGRLMLNVLLSFAQFEREIISERTRDKIAATRRKGKWSGGAPILGYDVVDTKLVVNELEAERVRQIFALYLDYQSLLPVVHEVDRRGWMTKEWCTKKGVRRGGHRFTKNRVYQILTNVTYAGRIRYKSEVHAGEHQAIVDPELWQQVQRLLQRNGRTGGAEVRNKYGALLRGLLHCGACNCSMTHTYSSKGSRRYRYYTCSNAQKRGRATCPSKSVPAGEIERFVVDQIRAVGTDPQVISETFCKTQEHWRQQREQLGEERRLLERELGRANTELGRVSEQVLHDRTGAAAARLADLQEQICRGGRRLMEIREQAEVLDSQSVGEHEVADAMASFGPVWEALSPREQARLLQLLIERVVYDGREGTVSITFQPTGIQCLTDRVSRGGEAA